MKNAVITGASRGIGKAIAIKLAKLGYRVIINYNKSENDALDLKSSLVNQGYSAEVFKCDVCDYQMLREMLYHTYTTFGSLDLLVNNAGVSIVNDICSTSLEDWSKMLNTNLSSVFYACKIATSIMKEQCFGKIINISSIWGEVGGSMEVGYSATKGGVIALTKALAKELALMNINVNCVCPGAIDTQMNNFNEETKQALLQEIPLQRIGKPEDIAEAVAFLAESTGDYITGQVLSVNGGLNI